MKHLSVDICVDTGILYPSSVCCLEKPQYPILIVFDQDSKGVLFLLLFSESVITGSCKSLSQIFALAFGNRTWREWRYHFQRKISSNSRFLSDSPTM